MLPADENLLRFYSILSGSQIPKLLWQRSKARIGRNPNGTSIFLGGSSQAQNTCGCTMLAYLPAEMRPHVHKHQYTCVKIHFLNCCN